ncbi:hypothetical protein GCM10010502_62210 [Kitasatospora aureofaciens]|uniref:Uncharacterized protein n=1 Tax=Kitasatospora aureofaciens TaxID=1894 RepID=A0A8H9HXZ5_KITAU|nr:hypothetical protein GCM10010502_62210 [Kitasatospora aureofaciens]
MIKNDFAARTVGVRTAVKWLGAPWQGPVPVNHEKGGDVMKGTRSRVLAYARHPAVERPSRSRSGRGAVVVCVAGPAAPVWGCAVT